MKMFLTPLISLLFLSSFFSNAHSAMKVDTVTEKEYKERIKKELGKVKEVGIFKFKTLYKQNNLTLSRLECTGDELKGSVKLRLLENMKLIGMPVGFLKKIVEKLKGNEKFYFYIVNGEKDGRNISIYAMIDENIEKEKIIKNIGKNNFNGADNWLETLLESAHGRPIKGYLGAWESGNIAGEEVIYFKNIGRLKSGVTEINSYALQAFIMADIMNHAQAKKVTKLYANGSGPFTMSYNMADDDQGKAGRVAFYTLYQKMGGKKIIVNDNIDNAKGTEESSLGENERGLKARIEKNECKKYADEVSDIGENNGWSDFTTYQGFEEGINLTQSSSQVEVIKLMERKAICNNAVANLERVKESDEKERILKNHLRPSDYQRFSFMTLDEWNKVGERFKDHPNYIFDLTSLSEEK